MNKATKKVKVNYILSTYSHPVVQKLTRCSPWPQGRLRSNTQGQGPGPHVLGLMPRV